jgi:uncharacterized protein YjbI with pentapeptide repeats
MGKNHLGSTTGFGTIFDQVKRSIKKGQQGVDTSRTVVKLRGRARFSSSSANNSRGLRMIRTTVSISRNELLSHSPCREGLAFFDSIAPSGSIEIEWNAWLSLYLCVPWCQKDRFGPWLVEKGLIPAPYLSRAYLGEADLTGANLREANLSEAYLSGANLTGANLSRAYLRGADLSGANLSRAYLGEADLTGANLREADLSRANLSEAYLRGADLSGATWISSFSVPVGWKIENDLLIRS